MNHRWGPLTHGWVNKSVYAFSLRFITHYIYLSIGPGQQMSISRLSLKYDPS